MGKILEKVFSGFWPYRIYRDYRTRRKNTAKYHDWMNNGNPVPPPHIVKQLAVQEYASRFRIGAFVETGTYHGDMVQAVKGIFDRIISIELDPRLYEDARRKFRKFKHITILHGDSGVVLKDVTAQLDVPSLFWLDGHYSGGETSKGALETPIMSELESIYRHPLAKDHVILIDDARCFNDEGDYPDVGTIEESTRSAGYDCFEIKDDIIRISRSR